MKHDTPETGKRIDRPTGKGWFLIGGMFLAASLLATVMLVFAVEHEEAMTRLYMAAICLGAAMPFLAVGSIIRAIWFLSGDAAKILPKE